MTRRSKGQHTKDTFMHFLMCRPLIPWASFSVSCCMPFLRDMDSCEEPVSHGKQSQSGNFFEGGKLWSWAPCWKRPCSASYLPASIKAESKIQARPFWRDSRGACYGYTSDSNASITWVSFTSTSLLLVEPYLPPSLQNWLPDSNHFSLEFSA